MSNTLLGVAYLEHDPGAAFWDATMRTTMENLRSFEGQETSNLLWACARLGRSAPRDVVDALLEQSAARNLGGMASVLAHSVCGRARRWIVRLRRRTCSGGGNSPVRVAADPKIWMRLGRSDAGTPLRRRRWRETTAARSPIAWTKRCW